MVRNAFLLIAFASFCTSSLSFWIGLNWVRPLSHSFLRFSSVTFYNFAVSSLSGNRSSRSVIVTVSKWLRFLDSKVQSSLCCRSELICDWQCFKSFLQLKNLVFLFSKISFCETTSNVLLYIQSVYQFPQVSWPWRLYKEDVRNNITTNRL